MIDLRRRPEILFAPIVVLFLLANFTTIGDPIAFQGWLPVSSFFFLTQGGPVQPYTVAAGWASLIGVFVVLTRYGRLDHVRSFVISGSLPIGAVGVFEAIYQSLVGWTWTVAQSEGYHPLLLLVAWSLPGFVGVAWWRITRLWIALLALTGAGFVGWFAVGMAPPTTFIGFAFNVPLKIAVFVLLSLPIVERCVPRIERLFPKTGKHPSERSPSDGS